MRERELNKLDGFEAHTDEEEDDDDDDDEEIEEDEDEDEDDEASGYGETEVEEQIIDMAGDEFVLASYVKEDEPADWMQTLHVKCIKDGRVVGTARGRYVDRDKNWMRANFWTEMDAASEDLSTIGFELFDRYGRLKEEFKSHIVRKGSGVWGDELDLGSFFVIEHLLVNAAWRRKGIGSKLTNTLMSNSRKSSRSPVFMIVLPGVLTEDVNAEMRFKPDREQAEFRSRAIEAAIAFYRFLGFRRVGASLCFGLATDPDHRARSILPEADFDPREAAEEEDFFDEPSYVVDWEGSYRLQDFQERYPLQLAVSTLKDDICVKLFKESKFTEDQWTKCDRFSQNILHHAASSLKPRVVRWLLENSDQTFPFARSVDGYTPLEALQAQLDNRRGTCH